MSQSSADISNYNITCFIHKLTTGEEYSPLRSASTKLPFADEKSSQSRQLGSINQEVIVEEVDVEESHSSQEESNGKVRAKCSQEDSKSKGVELSQDSSDSSTTSNLRGPLFNGEYCQLCARQDSISTMQVIT